MANAEHLAILRQGVDAWNAWREKEPRVRPDLSKADLIGADLSAADLIGADLSAADLRAADLRGANLIGANLIGANLIGANLIDACLDGADLTDARLWETQRGGWSIKNVICRFAFWDRHGLEPTKYQEGEFERIFAEKPHIILRYAGGISPIDLLALPLVVERLQAEYPGSILQIHSMQNDAGGASVTITVEDRENRSTEAFATEVEALRRDLLTIQHRLRSEESLRLEITAKYQAVTEDVLPKLLARIMHGPRKIGEMPISLMG
jgi:Pentapeptide repeats (8 copies)